MFPAICTIGPFTIYSYGLMLALAFMVSSSLASARARRAGENGEIIFNFCFLSLIFGIIGARIFYVADNLKFYLKQPLEILMLQHGGLSWYGGFMLGSIGGIWYLRKRKFPIYTALDLIAPYLALAQAIGRIGCLLNGCCYGKESISFGIYFPVHEATLIPTQIYSSILLLLIFIFLKIKQEGFHLKGEVFFLYLLLYSIKRFFIEFWRGDNPIVFLGLTLFQIISIFIFIFSVIGLIRIYRSRK